jgi:hypothetical protein
MRSLGSASPRRGTSWPQAIQPGLQSTGYSRWQCASHLHFGLDNRDFLEGRAHGTIGSRRPNSGKIRAILPRHARKCQCRTFISITGLLMKES